MTKSQNLATLFHSKVFREVLADQVMLSSTLCIYVASRSSWGSKMEYMVWKLQFFHVSSVPLVRFDKRIIFPSTKVYSPTSICE